MSYDHWKTTNPDDQWLGSAPQSGDLSEPLNSEKLSRIDCPRCGWPNEPERGTCEHCSLEIEQHEF